MVHRDGSGIAAHYTTKAFYCFHTVNAFEDGDDIHIDLSSFTVCKRDGKRVMCRIRGQCRGCIFRI